MMSIREFARRLGITEGAVRAAIRDGRISRRALGSVTTKTGKTRPAIADSERAAFDWQQNTKRTAAEPLAADLTELRRRRDKAVAMRALAQMFDSTSRAMLREQQLVSRASVVVVLATLERETVEATPVSQRRATRRILRSFTQEAVRRIGEAPAGKLVWPKHEHMAARLAAFHRDALSVTNAAGDTSETQAPRDGRAGRHKRA